MADAARDERRARLDVEPDSAAARDDRCAAQRNHDALKAVMRNALMSGELGQHNGLPVTVVVSTTLAELQAGAGLATTSAGTRMPIPDLIRLAEHAHHYLLIYRHHTAEPLYLGRTKRLANKAQRLVMISETGVAPCPAARWPRDDCQECTPSWTGRSAAGPTSPASGSAVDGTTGWPTKQAGPTASVRMVGCTGTHHRCWTPGRAPSTTSTTPTNSSNHLRMTDFQWGTARIPCMQHPGLAAQYLGGLVLVHRLVGRPASSRYSAMSASTTDCLSAAVSTRRATSPELQSGRRTSHRPVLRRCGHGTRVDRLGVVDRGNGGPQRRDGRGVAGFERDDEIASHRRPDVVGHRLMVWSSPGP